ncbi:hypothetical protein EV05_0063 [Prochlorococcus sp. MIT 0601]|nr:hypothetical protein EV05_0063 [Prochlorococcus sp. MIT 0601]
MREILDLYELEISELDTSRIEHLKNKSNAPRCDPMTE